MDRTEESVVSGNMNHLTSKTNSQINKQTLGKKTCDKVKYHMDNVVPDVEPVVHDTMLSAKKTFYFPGWNFQKGQKTLRRTLSHEYRV